jgi:hypothetical protein
MATNLLYLPVCIIDCEASTNADWLDGLEYWDAQPPAGNPIDLAGIAFALEMRSAPPAATVVLRATTDNGFIQVYANTWALSVPAATMALVPPGDYVFDLLGMADGQTRNLVQATVAIDLGITRSVIPTATTLPTAEPILAPVPLASSITRVIGYTKEAA